MANLVETLFGIAIVCALVSGLAFIQSKSGGEGVLKYRARLRRFGIVALVSGVLAVIGELWLQMR